MNSPRHRAFSPWRIAAITANTLTELTRLKVFYVLLFFALLLIGSSIFMKTARFTRSWPSQSRDRNISWANSWV